MRPIVASLGRQCPASRSLGLVVLIMGFVCPAGGSAHGAVQQAEQLRPAFRASVHINTVAVAVTGADGLPVTDLTAEDFELRLDGEPQDISFVLTPDDVRLELAVLIDSSQSIRRYATNLKPELEEFLHELETGDCFFVLPFADSVGPGYWNVDVVDFVDNLEFDGNTKLNDAIVSALDALSPRTGGSDAVSLFQATRCGGSESFRTQRRQAIVLITDGRDQGSIATGGEVLLRAWFSRVPFVVLGLGQASAAFRGSPRRRSEAAEYIARLEALVAAAGGRFVQAGRDVPQDLVFDEALNTLRSTYILVYGLAEPPTSVVPEWHTIDVRSRRDNVVLAAPEGVYLSAVRRADAGTLTNEARQQLADGRSLAALDILTRAVDADAEFWQPYFVRAMAAIQLGLLDEAEADVRRAVYLQPLASETHALLAGVLLEQGRLDLASASAVNAGYLGHDVGPMVAALERDHGEVLDIEGLAEVPRVWVVTENQADLPVQQTAERIRRLLMQHVTDDPDLALIAPVNSFGRTYGVQVELAEVLPDGALEGSLTISSYAAHLRGFRPPQAAKFEMTAEEAASLIGAAAPEIPASLVDAFESVWRRRNSTLRMRRR